MALIFFNGLYLCFKHVPWFDANALGGSRFLSFGYCYNNISSHVIGGGLLSFAKLLVHWPQLPRMPMASLSNAAPFLHTMPRRSCGGPVVRGHSGFDPWPPRATLSVGTESSIVPSSWEVFHAPTIHVTMAQPIPRMQRWRLSFIRLTGTLRVRWLGSCDRFVWPILLAPSSKGDSVSSGFLNPSKSISLLLYLNLQVCLWLWI